MPKTSKVELDTKTYERIRKRLGKTEFKTVDEYVNFVLKEVLEQVDKKEPVYSEEDERKVKERLRALGYLD